MYELFKPSTVTFVAIFIINAIICRFLLNHMTNTGLIRPGSDQFKKAIIFYFIPVLGALGLLLLYLSYQLKVFFKWLFLSHHKPAPVAPTPTPVRKKRAPQTANNARRTNAKAGNAKVSAPVAELSDEEIMRRASVIALNNAKAKIKANQEFHAAKKKRSKAYTNGK